MPALIDPTQGFTLADMPGDLPDNLPAGQQAPAQAEAAKPDTPDTPETPEVVEADPEQPEPAPKDEPNPKEEDEATNLNEAMDRQRKATQESEKEAAEVKKKEEEAAAAKAEAEKAGKATDKPSRDADLDKIQLAPQAHEKTRKVLNEVKSHAKAARDRADQLEKESNELRQRVADLEKQSKEVVAPKELTEEVTRLRERVRELDISKDPELETKYDAKIAKNTESVVGILKQFQFDKMRVKDGDVEKLVDNPRAIPELLKSGVTMKTMKPIIDKLNEAGYVDEAEVIADAVRENRKLAQDKDAEIQTWKSGYEGRIKQREAQTKAQAEARQKAISSHRDEFLNKDIETLAKDLPFINPPEGPQAGDSPTVVKAKQALQKEYADAQARIKTAIAGLDAASAPPEKFAEVAGRLSANAIQAVVLKEHAIPRLVRDLASANARIKELEADAAKVKAAGKLSRAQGSTPNDGPSSRQGPEFTSLDEALGDGPE
jgi:myosin heavy subunit